VPEAGQILTGALFSEAMRVVMRPVLAEGDQKRIGRCLEVFEDFCIVTQSVRDGIDIQVDVELD